MSLTKFIVQTCLLSCTNQYCTLIILSEPLLEFQLVCPFSLQIIFFFCLIIVLECMSDYYALVRILQEFPITEKRKSNNQHGIPGPSQSSSGFYQLLSHILTFAWLSLAVLKYLQFPKYASTFSIGQYCSDFSVKLSLVLRQT